MLQTWIQNKSLRADALQSLNDIDEKDPDPYLVRWAPEDKRNPQNWSLPMKWSITLQVAAIAFVVGMAGSINSGADAAAAQKFGVSAEVMALQTALFLIGFGVSAPAMGPLSELSGRLPVYLFPLLVFSAFSLGSGFAPNIQTRVILRFFAGFFGAAPLSNAGGSIADMSGPIQRSYLFPIFSFFGFCGTPLGAIFGGWIGERTNQGWCDWLSAILGLAIVIVLFFFMPETLSSQILKARAMELRKATGNEEYCTPIERNLKNSKQSFFMVVLNSIWQPVKFLATEPITLCFAMYLTIVYIILFGDLESYPLIFTIYGWDSGKTGSVFAAVFVGMCLTGAITPWTYKIYLNQTKKALEKGEQMPPPEIRLNLAIYGTWTMPIALFWGAWTAYKSISPWSLIVSQFVFGIGALCCFISSYMYVIDVYQVNAASPLASLVLLRYVTAGAGSIMFTRPMFEGIGIHWAMSLLGFLSVAISLVPVIFSIYGPEIRRKSKYAMSQ